MIKASLKYHLVRMGIQLQLGTIITMMGILMRVQSLFIEILVVTGVNWGQQFSRSGFDQSGHTVELNSDGTRVVIGALNNDGNGDSAGHVRVYEYSNSEWTQMGSDIDGDAEDDRLGDAVSINSDGTVIAIGATGHDVVANVTTTSVTIRAYPNKRAGNHVHNSHFSVATAGTSFWIGGCC